VGEMVGSGGGGGGGGGCGGDVLPSSPVGLLLVDASSVVVASALQTTFASQSQLLISTLYNVPALHSIMLVVSIPLVHEM